MRTLILSDLHLGNGGPYDIFAGATELPQLLRSLANPPTHVILNGDSFDFLLNADPLTIDVQHAVAQAQSVMSSAQTAPSLLALGNVLARGGRATIMVGNHDLELALPEVQAVVRGALGQPADVASRLEFRDGTAPLVLDVGGAKVLVTHGEQADAGNRIDYPSLLSPERSKRFQFPPGSVLVKSLLNPLKSKYRMRYLDLLKPDFEGAIMVALGVQPSALKVLLTRKTFTLIQRFLENRKLPPAFAPAPADADEFLARRLAQVDLDDSEVEALLAAVNPETPVSFGATGLLSSARLKLCKAGLALYARLHRRLAGESGAKYFALEPEKNELAESERLSRKYQCQAVVMGHTHAARWYQKDGRVYVNTGTWIGLLRLPAPEATDAEWAAYLAELQTNPELDPAKQKLARVEHRFTCVELMPLPTGRGASLHLAQFKDGALETLGSTELPAGS